MTRLDTSFEIQIRNEMVYIYIGLHDSFVYKHQNLNTH
jgi:hypothetical protein